jgi:predicted ribosomally synthesized peptide with SipW-like signal peptide
MADNTINITRRKILASIGTVGAASAAAGYGTSALFSDEEEIENNTLAAGELDLKVDWQQTYTGPIPNSGGEVGTHPVNAHPDDDGDGVQDIAGVLFGIEFDEDLYEIDLDTNTATEIASSVGASVGTSPNGLAYDGDNDRLYYSVHDSSSASELWFYDRGTGNNVNAFAGVSGSRLAGSNPNVSGSWYDGKYWYIPNKTTDLHAVEFNSAGKVTSDTIEKDLVPSGSRIYRFGDIAINSRGIVFGSTNGTQGSTAELFRYEIGSSSSYEELYTNDPSAWSGDRGGDPTGLQLAFDETGTLHGHDAGSGEFFEIDAQNKELTSVGSAGDLTFTDTANRIDDYDPCQRADPVVPDAYQSNNYPNQEHLIELDDVKPGDEGEITFRLHLCDNPGYIWLTADNFEEDSGTTTEPEPTPDDGELAENIIVNIWYDEDCNNQYADGEQQIFGPGFGPMGNEFTEYGGGNPATLAKAMEVIIDNNGGRVPLDGQSPFMGYEAGATDSERDCLPGETTLCVGFTWEVPIDVGNEIQGDTVEFDLGFYTEQCRNNDGSLGS